MIHAMNHRSSMFHSFNQSDAHLQDAEVERYQVLDAGRHGWWVGGLVWDRWQGRAKRRAGLAFWFWSQVSVEMPYAPGKPGTLGGFFLWDKRPRQVFVTPMDRVAFSRQFLIVAKAPRAPWGSSCPAGRELQWDLVLMTILPSSQFA